ncbi:hypothetical protein FKP32DRAFT_1590176 [Trametes sanguinea]|nr:hypothetical protein FKP32DRAFT_1590176 [Trametes sanguinea]
MTRARVLPSPPPYALDRPPPERPPSEVHLSPNVHPPIHPHIIANHHHHTRLRLCLPRATMSKKTPSPSPPSGVAPPGLPCLASARARYSRPIDAAALRAGSSRASLALTPARVGRLA